MRYFRFLRRFSAVTAYTAVTFVATRVTTLFPQSGNTVATQHCTLHWLLSRLKMPFNGRVSGSSGNTFKNLSESNEYSHSYDLPDEFDHEDYDEWWEHREQDFEDCEEWWDGPVYNRRGKCWEEEAVDEAIEEEQNGGSIGDIPF